MGVERAPSKLFGWVKAAIGSMMAAGGGAMLMYLSPVVTQVIKPAKPVANFGQSPAGLSVTFQNRATGAYEGWWDFGDGSALEPFNPKQEALVHTYPRPGTYVAKLSLRNLLGEENERAVTVNLDPGGGPAPVVESFEVVPLRPDFSAPASFRLLGKVKNAEYCIWSLGEDRPLEISADVKGTLDRLVTLKESGYFTLRLVAVNGKQTAEKAETVYVGLANTTNPEVMLQVTFQAVRVDRQEVPVNLQVKFPPERGESTYPFVLERGLEPGFDVVEARFARKISEDQVKNAKVDVSADKRKVVLSGELVRTGFLSRNAPPSWVAPLVVTLERRTAPLTQASDPVMVNLNVPGTTTLPMPVLAAGWVVQSRKLNFELRDGSNVVWRDTKLPVGAVVQMKNRPVSITATEQPGQVRLDVVEVKSNRRP